MTTTAISQQQVFALIRELTGTENIIAVSKFMVKLLGGDITSAYFLSQLIFWSDKTSRPDGFIYKGHTEWTDEIGLNRSSQRRARAALEKRGLIETKVHRANGSPTVHYRVCAEALTKSMIRFAETGGSDSDHWLRATNPLAQGAIPLAAGSQTLTETTTENTTEYQPKESNPEPPPAPTKKAVTEPTNGKTANPKAMFSALAKLCGIDLRVLTSAQRGLLNQTESILRNEARAGPHDLAAFGEWWHTNDWRGKKGDVPRPQQVREEWAKFCGQAKSEPARVRGL